MVEPPQSNTFVYRTVHQPEPAATLQLKVDVYSPPNATDNKSPVLVYFHSGGLTAGSRQLNSWFPTWILDHALSLGFTFVIPDYTLLMPGDAHNMLEDVKGLANWLRTDLNKALQDAGLRDVRTEDIVVVGQSAGGYLAYLMSTHINPPPKAIAVFYGMGGDFLLDMHVVPKKEKYQHWVPFLTDSKPFEALESRGREEGIILGCSTEDETRVHYFSWMLQNAIFLDRLLGIPGISAELGVMSRAEREVYMSSLEARKFLPQLLIGPNFPPSYLVHGGADTAVRAEESRNLVRKLEELGVEHVYKEFGDLEHGFDWLDCPRRLELDDVIPFLLRHVNRG
ncbi:hypothetical protein I312_100763 [Cryptococcus bacillisporus CA1280]|uniref:BD-FAE-like domain-containing protein n=2 Tax=Cryptococcus gattii TaxID=552467 RepID=A0A0D0VFZ1_CRYGA|nr:hypothetical protein I312_04446 [Cryptococcus bacillisporus CA1280]KIR59524.1 hypothetical protein I314_04510 [Cryptococcus bacillisporus CA1873]|eukprot:KIR59524.1 hypothetical protein I314_04510 [Cryptococcus gattii CA1873]